MSQVSKRQLYPLEMQIISTFFFGKLRDIGSTNENLSNANALTTIRRSWRICHTLSSREILIPALKLANHSSTGHRIVQSVVF
jgi:hypothetical protein